MNKSDLIEKLAIKEKISGKQATDIINLIFKGFENTMKGDGRIEIRGFGNFSVREYEQYQGRNPKTGNLVKVPPKKLPFFKIGKGMKELVDKQ